VKGPLMAEACPMRLLVGCTVFEVYALNPNRKFAVAHFDERALHAAIAVPIRSKRCN
jgi:hypothetical protein